MQLALNRVQVYVTAENGERCERGPRVSLEWLDTSAGRTTIRADLPEPDMLETDQAHCFVFNRWGVALCAQQEQLPPIFSCQPAIHQPYVSCHDTIA